MSSIKYRKLDGSNENTETPLLHRGFNDSTLNESTLMTNDKLETGQTRSSILPHQQQNQTKGVRRISLVYLFSIIGIIIVYMIFAITAWILGRNKTDDEEGKLEHLLYALTTSIYGFVIMVNELLLLGERRKVTQVRVDGYSRLYSHLMSLLGGCHYAMVIGTFLVNITLLGDMAANHNAFLTFIDKHAFLILVIILCMELITILALMIIVVRTINKHQSHPKAPDALTYMAVFGETELPDVSTDIIICGQGEAIYRMMTHLVNIQKQLATVNNRIQMCKMRGTTPVFEGLSDELKTIVSLKRNLESKIETDTKGTKALQTEISHLENQIHSSIRHWEERNRRRVELIERKKALEDLIAEAEEKENKKPQSYSYSNTSNNVSSNNQGKNNNTESTSNNRNKNLSNNSGEHDKPGELFGF